MECITTSKPPQCVHTVMGLGLGLAVGWNSGLARGKGQSILPSPRCPTRLLGSPLFVGWLVSSERFSGPPASLHFLPASGFSAIC